MKTYILQATLEVETGYPYMAIKELAQILCNDYDEIVSVKIYDPGLKPEQFQLSLQPLPLSEKNLFGKA